MSSWYTCPVCKDKLWIAIAEEFKENKVVFTVDFICDYCGSALIVSNQTGRVLLKPKGGNMPEGKKKIKVKKEKVKPPEKPKEKPPKEKPKPLEVGVPCPRCNKTVEMEISEGRYKTQISTKQISGKATNPDFPCPFCNCRLAMPKA
jgi:hypothetical protein